MKLNEHGTPASGTFDGWPTRAKELRVLDPCMGSGHFLTFALPILARMRVAEEGLSLSEAISVVLRDNLFGLELDPRCSQIAAFNLALTAWRLTGKHFEIPQLNLACSGLGINAKEEDWVKLAGKDQRVRGAMKALYGLLQQAPVLGSLIDPKRVGGDLFIAEFEKIQPLLESALRAEQADETTHELAVTAQGLVQVAQILSHEFTLVATNVPYLGRPDQHDLLKKYCDRFHTDARSDLATCFLDRCLSVCAPNSSVAVVTPQSWLFQSGYKKFRQRLLESISWEGLAKIGPRGFETISGEQVNVCLVILTRRNAQPDRLIATVDVAAERNAADKASALKSKGVVFILQSEQLLNPDYRIATESLGSGQLLSRYACCVQGLATSDDPQFTCYFWEFANITNGWEGLLGTVEVTTDYGGRERLIHWEDGRGRYFRHAQALKAEGRLGGWKSGTEARGKCGILVSQMSSMPVTIYTGEFYDHNASVLLVNDSEDIPAVWEFASSPEFRKQVRKLDQSLKPSNNVFVKVPFDRDLWRGIAGAKHPHGLPKPFSSDPTQWLFNGHPKGSDQPLHVAAVRLLGYQWPRQTGSSFFDCPALSPDGLEKHSEWDGIVCLTSLAGKPSAADRLRALLADSYGEDWSATRLAELLGASASLEVWLRDRFFEEHCQLFHESPFVWHMWDGRNDGFHALVNYHKLDHKTLEKLIYSYLGDWISRQRQDLGSGVEGADGRLAAAEHLQGELKKILDGEKPYDVFVRWKSVKEQPLGWNPDLNDGLCVNIRPWITEARLYRTTKAGILRVTPNIKYGKDRGKETARDPKEFPWFKASTERNNDIHLTIEEKRRARGLA